MIGANLVHMICMLDNSHFTRLCPAEVEGLSSTDQGPPMRFCFVHAMVLAAVSVC